MPSGAGGTRAALRRANGWLPVRNTLKTRCGGLAGAAPGPQAGQRGRHEGLGPKFSTQERGRYCRQDRVDLMEGEGRGKELEQLSVGGCLMGYDPSRSGT